MTFELSNLRVGKIIAHQIYKLNDEREVAQPKYSHEFTQLDTEGINTLQERMVSVLGIDSHCMEMSIQDDSEYSAYWIIRKALYADDDTLKKCSRELTYKLAISQASRKIPGGIVLIFNGLTGYQNSKFIAIVKAELHGGFSIQEEIDQLVLKFINDLLLTPQQKLYKVAIFIEKPRSQDKPIDSDDFLVLVYDHNVIRYETKQAARYFYSTFLGCEIAPSDKKLTRDFFMSTKEFIDEFIVDDEFKLDLNTALHAYLKVDQASVINVADFATRYLQESLRDRYLEFMMVKGFTENSTPKDITYIKNNLRQRNLKFSSDVKIVAPSDNFKNVINIVGKEYDNTIVQIKGHLERDD